MDWQLVASYFNVKSTVIFLQCDSMRHLTSTLPLRGHKCMFPHSFREKLSGNNYFIVSFY